MSKKEKIIHCTHPGCTSTYIENRTRMLCRKHNQERLKKEKSNQEENLKNMVETSTLKGTFGTISRCLEPHCVKPTYMRGKCVTHWRQERFTFNKALKKQEGKEEKAIEVVNNSEKNVSKTVSKKKSTIASVSKKNALVKAEMTKMKKEAKSIEQPCEGCLSHKGVLDYSHILSVGQRKDLELHPENKNMLCRECHQKWESWDPSKMITLSCFYNNMRFIYKHDTQRFWRVYFKFNDVLDFKVCKELENIEEEFKTDKNG